MFEIGKVYETEDKSAIFEVIVASDKDENEVLQSIDVKILYKKHSVYNGYWYETLYKEEDIFKKASLARLNSIQEFKNSHIHISEELEDWSRKE